jgi:shikimate dehydrogenase
VVRALAGAGAAEIAVVGRNAAKVERAVALANGVGRIGTSESVTDADLVVNATPLGMADTNQDRSLAVDPARLHPGQVVVDLVYHPLDTPLVRAAREVGADAANGVGMLVHQAGHQFRAWTGLEPPIGAMRSAVETALR